MWSAKEEDVLRQHPHSFSFILLHPCGSQATECRPPPPPRLSPASHRHSRSPQACEIDRACRACVHFPEHATPSTSQRARAARPVTHPRASRAANVASASSRARATSRSAAARLDPPCSVT
eukprot:scaffold77162_cov21-Phaeocystis_antarctica.AAC.1